MARSRDIRPEFFTDDKIGDLPYGARLLYIGIWCHSDFRGVFEHNAKQLKVLLFPYDEGLSKDTVGEWLQILEAQGVISRFESGGKTWGFVTKWHEHQKPSGKERAIGSKRPPPPGLDHDPPQDDPGSSPGCAQDDPVDDPGSTQAATPSPSPSPSPAPTPGGSARARPTTTPTASPETPREVDRTQPPVDQGDRDHLRMFRADPLYRALVRAGARAVDRQVLAWSGMVTRLRAAGMTDPQIIAGVEMVAATLRYPQQCEEACIDLRGRISKHRELAADHPHWFTPDDQTPAVPSASLAQAATTRPELKALMAEIAKGDL